MNEITKNSKVYEQILVRSDPIYEDLKRANRLVEEFIRAKKLIIYGGTAIDFALRLKGDKLYSDESLSTPDLDFYSPDCVTDAYELADILYDNGFFEARAISAEHAGTMRVDCGDRHFVADISYRAKEIFDKIPTLSYDGMLIVHPTFQRIDMHSALCHPYDNPPREVIFNRWEKDVKRFNMLDSFYPLEFKNIGAIDKHKLQFKKDVVHCGFAAYALLYKYYKTIIASDDGIIKEKIDGSTMSYTCPSFVKQTEIISCDPSADLARIGVAMKDVSLYEPTANIVPKLYVSERDNVRIEDATGRMTSANDSIDGYRIINVQYVLMQFISGAIIDIQHRDVYTNYYISLCRMIKGAEEYYISNKLSDVSSPLFLSIKTYGCLNESKTYKNAIRRLLIDMNGGANYEPLIVPSNYYPGRSKPRGVAPPSIDVDKIEFFHESGHKIET